MALLSYQEDTLFEKTIDLIDSCFPGIKELAQACSQLGIRWQDNSQPFCILDKQNNPIAHLGAIEFPLVIKSSHFRFLALHAICTHLAHRHQGHFHFLMQEALKFSDSNYEGTFLFTETPGLYTHFGFKTFPEWIFKWHKPASDTKTYFPTTLLNLAKKEAVELLVNLLRKRVPVSESFGVINEVNVSVFNLYNKKLYYSPDLNLILHYETNEQELMIYDIISNHYYAIDDILRAFNLLHYSKITFYFCPDQWQIPITVVPANYSGECQLMVRSAVELDFPFVVPLTCRC